MLTTLSLQAVLLSWLAALVLVPLARAWARRRDRLELPNDRSAHSEPTPGFGGIGIVVPTLGVLLWVFTTIASPDDLFVSALLIGGCSIALVSLIDDLRGLSMLPRLVVHIVACGGVALALMLPIEGLAGVLAAGSLALGLAWFVNLTNFMDGIDGLAAAFCLVFVLSLQLVVGGVAGYPGVVLWALAGACCGFLVFNWSPASIFMGDVGSAFVGFCLAALACALIVDGQVRWQIPLVLSAVFWMDASWTLGVRLLSGQRVTVAHSSHAYQVLARRFGHRRVTVGASLYMVAWCLPLACLLADQSSGWIAGLGVAGAAMPVLLVCIVTGAGRSSA